MLVVRGAARVLAERPDAFARWMLRCRAGAWPRQVDCALDVGVCVRAVVVGAGADDVVSFIAVAACVVVLGDVVVVGIGGRRRWCIRPSLWCGWRGGVRGV